MMRERPILFSGPMVRAILSGQKTQTRRVAKPQPDITQPETIPGAGICAATTPDDQRLGRLGKVIECPYGQPGDRLWVREAWHAARSEDSTPPRHIPTDADIEYAATARSYAEIGLKGRLEAP